MNNKVKVSLVVAILFALLVIFLPQVGKDFDDNMWIDWAIYIRRHGLAYAYNDPLVTYHPVYLYVLDLYQMMMGSEEFIARNIHYLKIFTLLFDFLPVVALCIWAPELVNEKKVPYLFLLLNIAYLYNTLAWGQIDAIHSNLILLALLLVFTRPTLAMLLMVFAFNTKQQTIIYIPVFLILMLYHIKDWKKIIVAMLAGAALQVLILLPFILAGQVGTLLHTVTHLVDYYRSVSIGAFNFWHFFFTDAYHTMDYNTFLGLTYKQIGLILFFTASGLTLLPLFFRLIKLLKNKQKVDDSTLQMLMLAGGLISIYFYYFNTQMHERYAHPMMIFFFFYGVFSRNYKLYILASISYFLNIEACLPNFLPIPHPKIIFAMRVIAIWYTITLAYGMWEFFRQYKPLVEYRKLKK